MSAAVHPLAALLSHGKTLAVLLLKAKNQQLSLRRRKKIHVEVRLVITNVLKDFDSAQGSAFFPEESIVKFVGKIDKTLEEFMVGDPGNKSHYEDLSLQVRDFKRRILSSSIALHPGHGRPDCNKTFEITNYFSPGEFEASYEGLTVVEKQCLFCFTLFPSGAEIKKRELIHLWFGMDLIDPSNNGGNKMLANLVAEGFVKRVIRNNHRFSGRYLMYDDIRFKIVDLIETNNLGRRSLGASWCTLNLLQQQTSGFRAPSLSTGRGGESRRGDKIGGDEIGAVLNISEKTLNAKRFESLSNMKNVKVLHLGNWQHDSKNYIVVDDIESYKDLKHLVQVQVLSLQGVSGIVNLPESIYKLENLMVLDLQGCHSLEVLPQGIESLKRLTHLDLSDCYLLDHIPRGVASLSRLQVLKGFVINRHENLDGNVENGSTQKKKRNKQKSRKAFAPSCPFHVLSKLQELRKLTVRTRNMNFPTNSNLQTLCEMNKLASLKIAWVGSSSADAVEDDIHVGKLPSTLKKMELQAVPEQGSWRMLRLLSAEKDNGLQKLYIRGGGLRELKDVYLLHVKIVRLRYLPDLHIDWDEFIELFPNLTSLEVLECPNLVFFPCDKNGIWELPFQVRMSTAQRRESLRPYTSRDMHHLLPPPAPPLPPPLPPHPRVTRPYRLGRVYYAP